MKDCKFVMVIENVCHTRMHTGLKPSLKEKFDPNEVSSHLPAVETVRLQNSITHGHAQSGHCCRHKLIII